MKVIKSGSGQRGWAHECSCTGAGNGNAGCGAVLLVEQADLFKTYSHALHETTTYVTFECPECEQWTDISSSARVGSVRIPSHIIRKLPSRAPGEVYTDDR